MAKSISGHNILERLNSLSLECDGLSRVASLLLTRENVPHSLNVGRLLIEEVGAVDWHCWISFDDGKVLDLRARMWLGSEDEVPHGLFSPEQNHQYITEQYVPANTIDPILLPILTGMTIDDFPQEFCSLLSVEFPDKKPKCRVK